MRLLFAISVIGMSLHLMACSTNGSQEDQLIRDVSALEMNELIENKGGQVLDVRTGEEVAGGRIPGAVNFDFYSDNFEEQLDGLDRNQPVYVYCAAGGRSGKSARIMKEKGFKEVYNLSEGFPFWKKAGLGVEQ